MEGEVQDQADSLVDQIDLGEGSEPIEDLEDVTEVGDEETPEESVRAAIEELKTEGNGNQNEEETSQDSAIDSKQPERLDGKPKKKTVVDFTKNKTNLTDGPLEPPVRLKPHQKDLFNKLENPELKKALIDTVRDLEATTTRANQELSAKNREVSGIIEAVKPYVDTFTERNISVAQGIASLCLVQKRLTDTTNPQQQFKTWLSIGEDIGYDVNAVKEALGVSAQSTKPNTIDDSPALNELREENLRLREMVEPLYNNFTQSAATQADAVYHTTYKQLESVQLETDGNGNYLRPELLQDKQFLESWKPLVSALVRNGKMSYKDAGIEAYARMTGKHSNLTNQSRLQEKNTKKSEVTGGISLRGRSIPTTDNSPDLEVNVDETPEQSARAALAELMRGRR